MSTLTLPSAQQLKRALEITEQIEKLEQEFRSIFRQGTTATPTSATAATAGAPKEEQAGKPKRVVSPETRAKMVAAQRKRRRKAKK